MQARSNPAVREAFDTFAGRLRQARKRLGLTQQQLANAAEVKQSDVSKIERGDTLTSRGIARLAKALEVDPLWLERGEGPPPNWSDAQHASGGIVVPTPARAQKLSQLQTEDAPRVTWGVILTTEAAQLPDLFWTELPDDSMAPRAPHGHRICIDRRLTPKAGDGVLVADAAGGVHFRQYRAGVAGRWSAAALNAAFDPLDSERDGLRIIGVLMAEEGRWA